MVAGQDDPYGSSAPVLSAVIRKQFDRVAEASHRMFADTFELEIALDEIGECAGQQHLSAQLLGQGFETRSHVDGGTNDGEIEPGARAYIAVHDVADMNADTIVQWRTPGGTVVF